MAEQEVHCFDMDSTFCFGGTREMDYMDAQPVPYMVDIVKKLKAAGHIVVFQTARFMDRFNWDQRKAIEYGEPKLRQWLDLHGIPYDAAFCGKVGAHYYWDDRGHHLDNHDPNNWERNKEWFNLFLGES